MQHAGFKAAACAADPRSLRRRTGAKGLCLRPRIEVPRGARSGLLKRAGLAGLFRAGRLTDVVRHFRLALAIV